MVVSSSNSDERSDDHAASEASTPPTPKSMPTSTTPSVQKLSKHEQQELRKQQRELSKQEGREANYQVTVKKKVILYSVIIIAIITTAAFLYIQSGKVKFEDIRLEDHPTIGPNTAPVTLAVFGDYQCPFTRNYWFKIQPRLQEEYGDKLRFAYLPMPTGRHRNDRISAEAAYCAANQGKWFEMAQKIFERQGQADRATLDAFAPQVGVDTNKFSACMDSEVYKNKVEDDYEYGKSINIAVTPTVFVNGVRLAGEYPYEEYKKAIDYALSNAQQK